MTAFASARRHAIVEGTFTRSMLAAATRGLGLVAAAVAIGVILLRVTDGGGGGPSGAIDVSAGSEETTTTTTADGVGPGLGLQQASQVTILVLNAARVEGVAGEITEKLKQLGHPTLTPGNAPPQDETVVFYKPGFEEEAAQVAPEVSDATLTQPLGDPPAFAGTEQADLVIVLGTEFAGDSGGTDTTETPDTTT